MDSDSVIGRWWKDWSLKPGPSVPWTSWCCKQIALEMVPWISGSSWSGCLPRLSSHRVEDFCCEIGVPNQKVTEVLSLNNFAWGCPGRKEALFFSLNTSARVWPGFPSHWIDLTPSCDFRCAWNPKKPTIFFNGWKYWFPTTSYVKIWFIIQLISNHLFQWMAIRSEVRIMWYLCAHVIHETADVNAIWGPVWCWDPSLAKSFETCFGQDGAPKEFRSGFPLQVSGCSRVIFNGEYVQQGQHVLNLKIEVLISKFVLVADL